MTLDEAYRLAVQQHQSGRLREAESQYRQLLAQQPAHADALHMLGLLAFQTGHLAEAERLIREAIRLNPSAAAYHTDLGAVLATGGDIPAAAEAFRQATMLQPTLAEAHDNLASALQRLGQIDPAIASFERALSLRPGSSPFMRHLADALQLAGKYQESAEVYRKLLKISAADPEDHFNLGNALRGLGQTDEAIALYQKAVELKPDFGAAHNNLANLLQLAGQIDRAIAHYRDSLRLASASAVWSNLIFALHLHPADDPNLIRQELDHWNEAFARPLAPVHPRYETDADPNRRLRVGYVSPHMGEHAVGRYLLPLLANHDKAAFEIFCYSDLARPDAITEQLRSHVDQWRDTNGIADEQLAEQIRRDRIDILVDLTMHMEGNRMLMFARKPAPVQVTWLGYPGSTGLRTMDYRLTDPYLDPVGMDESVYSEKTLRLPDSYWCYQPSGDEPEPNDLPALKNGFVTFGCLNHFPKINSLVLGQWARVLLAVPNSRLLILAPPGHARQRVLRELAQLGIKRGRVRFADRQPRLDYFRLYHQIDIGLDTFPYAGHTTSLDSLWMGVPVVTRTGNTAVSRGGASILSNAGLAELIARTSDEYVSIARRLASDLPKLAQLRSTLRKRMQASPLTHAAQFARDMEAAYRFMWKNTAP